MVEHQADGPAHAGASGGSRDQAGDLAAVLLHLYEATGRPRPWDCVMESTAPLFGTTKVMFARVDRTYPSQSLTEVIGLRPEHADALRNRDIDQDFIWRSVLSLAPGSVFRSTELLPKNVLHQGPLYEQIAQPAGLEYVLGIVIANRSDFFSNLCYMRAGPDFSDAEKALLVRLAPHLQLVYHLAERIASGDASRTEARLALDRAHQAIVVLDRSGYAIYRNAAAERVLRDARGVELKLGRFLFDSITTQTAFEHAVRVALAGQEAPESEEPHILRVARRGTGSPYVLSVIPLRRPVDRVLLPEGARCLVVVHDDQMMEPLPVERLAWLYRLTPAELRICETLYRVGSIDAVATALNLTQHTVRSHLKSIYSKLGVGTQSQLMQRLVSSAHHAADDSLLGMT